MYPNVKATEQVALLGEISPSSQSAGALTTAWVSAAAFQKFLALIQTGVLGASATVDAKIQQATDSSGTGAKDITGAAITQIVKATGDNVQAEINLDAQQLDVANGFAYVQLSMTVGTAASLTAASLFGFVPRFAPASDANAASVKQIVG
ncbi:hypothetical protein [Cupriavidus sp. BIC8F]|uniref:hypothetical protein n=1 Tax=Cupriavidus sp. BIC8F TaxID=3079014 RepID=UPI0029162441|nr:hypothetical protein [Cupriavidus sp. BIC8F]